MFCLSPQPDLVAGLVCLRTLLRWGRKSINRVQAKTRSLFRCFKYGAQSTPCIANVRTLGRPAIEWSRHITRKKTHIQKCRHGSTLNFDVWSSYYSECRLRERVLGWIYFILEEKSIAHRTLGAGIRASCHVSQRVIANGVSYLLISKSYLIRKRAALPETWSPNKAASSVN